MFQTPGELIAFLTEVIRSNNVKQTGTNDPSNAVLLSKVITNHKDGNAPYNWILKAKIYEICVL